MKRTLKESMIDKKNDEEEAEQLKQIYIHYVDKRIDIMNSTKFKVEEFLVLLFHKILFHLNK